MHYYTKCHQCELSCDLKMDEGGTFDVDGTRAPQLSSAIIFSSFFNYLCACKICDVKDFYFG